MFLYVKRVMFRSSILTGGIVLCLFMAGGCASLVEHKNMADEGEEGFIAVPFIRQQPNYCGPAALAMVLAFWDKPLSQEEIAKKIYSQKLGGTLSLDLLLFAMQNGFYASMYNGNFLDIKKKIQAGFPLIVSHQSHTKDTIVHYIVIVGFSDEKKEVYAHTERYESLAMSYGEFMRRWSLANNLVFFIHPKNSKFITEKMP